MWVGLILLGLLVLAGFGGITGRGVYDSRDPAYSLRLPDPPPIPCPRANDQDDAGGPLPTTT